jgi:UDPglucose 6-dehydrogenase
MGHTVVGVDYDAQRIAGLNAGTPPLFEPGLDELLHRNLASGRLRYTVNLPDALRGSSFVFITYDTPVDEDDKVDLTQLFSTTAVLAEHLDPGTVVIISSQVPVGTCEQLHSVICARKQSCEFGLAYVPENLRLGRALERFMKPAMVIIGSKESSTLDRVEKLYSALDSPIVRMDLPSAEMTKHAINSYLATCVSFINEISNLCDESGADATRVATALRMDERVSPHAPLLPGGLGFAGGTLARDLRALQALGKRVNHPTHLVDAVLSVNQEQKRLIWRRLHKVYGSVKGLNLGVLGLTYKPGTSTLRRSVAIEIMRELAAAGASIKAYDPKAALEELNGEYCFYFCRQPAEVAKDSDAIIIITEWPEFKSLDYAALAVQMKHRVLIDTKNLLDPNQLRALGFTYFDVGRGSASGPLQTTGEHNTKGATCG